MDIFGLNKLGIEAGILYGSRVVERFSPATILEAVFLVTLGIMAFHTGGLLSMPLALKRMPLNLKREAKLEEKPAMLTAKALRIVGWGLLAISIVPAFWFLRDSLAVVSSYSYMGLFRADLGPAYVTILSSAIGPAAIFLLAGSKSFRFNIALSGIVVLTYSSTLLLVGNRHAPVMLLIAYAWVYHRCIRPIPKVLLLSVGSLILLVVNPVVAVFRIGSGSERFSLNSLLDAFSSIDNPIVASISEMGFSMVTVAYTIDLVPGYRDFDMGVSYLYALFSVIPSLFWAHHPTAVHGTLDDWLIYTVDPLQSSAGNSYGFSFIAEAYLNFGWLGAPFVLGAIGFFLGWFVLWVDNSADLAKIAMAGSFTAFLLLFARGESNEVIRFLVWYSLIPYWGVCYLRWLMKPKFYETSSQL